MNLGFFSSKNVNSTAKLNQYNEYLDTLKATLKFIGSKTDAIKNLGKPINEALCKAGLIENKLKYAADIQKYMVERKALLKEQLTKFGFLNKIKGLEKTTYYYKAYVNEYKDLLKDKGKLEKKAMALLYKVPAFKTFVSNNSALASIFKIGGGIGISNSPYAK